MKYILAAILSAVVGTGFSQIPLSIGKKNGPTGGRVMDVEYDATGGKYYAVVDYRLFYSSDNGQTWQDLVFSGSDDSFYEIEIANNTIYLLTGYDLYASTDQGATFTKRNSVSSVLSGSYKLKRNSSGRLIALASNRVRYSTDNGVTWTLGASGSFDTKFLAINSSDQIFVKENLNPGKIRKSVDGGATFADPTTQPGGGTTATAFSLMANNSGSLVYTVTADNIYSSVDGNAWTSIKYATVMTDVTIASSVAPSFLEFSADGLGMYFVDALNRKLYSKTVSGATTTWGSRATSFPSSTVSISCAAAKDFTGPASSTVVFGAVPGIYQTTTGAASYQSANAGLSEINPRQLVSVFNGELLMLTYDIGLMKSGDNGDNWSSPATAPQNIDFLTSNSDEDVFMTNGYNGGYQTHRSLDKGDTWSLLTTPVAFEWVGGTDNDRFFGLASDGRSFYYSYNNGTNWTASAVPITGLPGAPSYFNATTSSISFASSTQMFLQVYNYNTSVYEYYRIAFVYSGTTISSATATLIPTASLPFANIDKIFGRAGKLYAFTDNTTPNKYAISTNGGTVWTTKEVPGLGGSAEFFVGDNGYLFVISDQEDHLFISRDDGTTFEEVSLPTGTQGYNIKDIILDGFDFLVLAVYKDFVQRSNRIVVTPTAPTNIAEVAKVSTAVTLRWDDNATNEEYYQIEYSTNGTNYTVAGSVDAYRICGPPGTRGFYAVEGLAPSTAYTFRIASVNNAGKSTYLTSGTITTPATVAQTVPANRSWSAVNSGESGFAVTLPQTVGVRHLGSGVYEISDAALGRIPTNSSAIKGKFYVNNTQTMMLRSEGTSDDIVSNGLGSWNGTNILTLKWRQCDADETETITLTLAASDPAPSAPTVQALVISNTAIEIKWTTGFYDKDYIVERSPNGTTGFVQIGTNVSYPSNSLIDNGPFVDGTTYYYRVTARNGNVSPLTATSSNASLVFKAPNFIVSNTEVSNFVATTVGTYWADFDNDGDDDLFTLDADLSGQALASATAFKNLGTGDFQKITLALDPEKYIFGSVADFNNDGFTDLGLAIDEGNGIDLYLGVGDFTFTKMTTSQKGDLGTLAESIQSTSWADINKDGRLDLFLLSENVILLYKQNSDGTFTSIPGGDFATYVPDNLSAQWADYNNDGNIDVILSGDQITLFKNNGNETFTIQASTGITATGAFSIAWGDYTNDGWLDLFIGVVGAPGAELYKNNGDGTFTKNVSTSVTESGFVIGGTWGDFNNDGLLDLIAPGYFGSLTRLYINTSTLSTTSFNRIVTEKINDVKAYHIGAGTADYDNNGFLDVSMASLIANSSSDNDLSPLNFYLYKNNNSTGNWSRVRLQGTVSNKGAVGARLVMSAGGKTYTRDISAPATIASQNSAFAHFGLGATSSITSLTIYWPNGGVQTYTNPPINQLLTISEDLAGPAVTLLSPLHSAGNVSVSTTIEITLNEASTPVGGKNLVVTGQGDGSPFATLAVTAAAVSGNKYTFTLPGSLVLNKLYNLTLDAGAFTDMWGNGSAAISTWSFTTGAGPQLVTLNPGNNTTNINTNTKLEITFNVPTQPVAGKLLSVYTGTNPNPVLTMDASTAVLSGNTQSFTLPANLSTETVHRISLEAGAFKDASNNPSVAIAATAWNFTTVAGPKVLVLTPADEATGIHANTTLAMEFDKSVTPVASKNLRVYQSGVTDPIHTILLSAGVASASNTKYSYTLPTKLSNQVNYYVIVDPLSFADANGNLFSGIAATQWDFRTAQGPAIATYNPTVGASNVAINASIILTFDKAITAVAGKKIKVYTSATTTIVDADVSTTGSVSGSSYTLPAPTTGWPFQTLLAVVLDAGAFVDANLNDGAGLSGVQYSFTTVEAADVEPPTFAAFIPPTSFDKGFGTQVVSIEITDNKAVTEAKLFHRPITGTTVSEIVGVSKPNNRWEFTVPETAFDQSGVQFYLTAADAAANSKRQPVTGYYTVNLKYPAEIDVTNAIGFGGQKKDWKIFTYPFDGTNSIATVFDELTGEPKKDYRILKYENATAWVDFPSFTSFTRGVGYFVNVKTSKAVKLSSGLVAPSNTKSDLFKINLKQGWNMIGNPYLSNIAWADVVAFNSLTGQSADFLTYDGATNSYVKKTSAIEPFTGGFVFIAAAKNDVSIPFFGQTTPGGRTYEEQFNDNDWSLPIVLEQNGMRNEFGGIGMHANARESYDDFDRVNPPFIGDFAEINFSHPEHFSGRFAKDVVPSREGNIWSFKVETSEEGMATLQWDATSIPDELYLFDELLQLPVNMREIQQYTFDTRKSNRFKIFYGKDAKESMASNRVQLGAAFPNPSNAAATIPFSLPKEQPAYNVQVEVFDLMGRKVNTLLNAVLAPGFYQTVWTPEEGQTAGIYTYRLSVSAGGTGEVLSGKVMLKK